MTQRTYAFDGVARADRGSWCRASVPWGVVTNKAQRFTEPLTRGMALFASAAAPW